MLLPELFQRFVELSPVTVMARSILENALSPSHVESLFQQTAQRQYTRSLLFSDVVNLMSTVVCRIHPSINAAYKKSADILGVTRKAVYEKINHVELDISAALVRHTATALLPVIDAMDARHPVWLSGYHTKILDGSHLPGTEHRLKPLRTIRAAALPGQALVIYSPEADLVLDVILCDNAHAQERSLTPEILQQVQPNDLWIDDRNFCTSRLLVGMVQRQGFFITRQHATTLCWEPLGDVIDQGRGDTGTLSEQRIRVSDPQGDCSLILRRIVVNLDEPTRHGEKQIAILTNLPTADANAAKIAELYRQRWRIETAFGELEKAFDGEMATLGQPKAALFAFCVALMAFNVQSTIKAAIRSEHGAEVEQSISGSDLAEEVAATHRGLIIAIPEDEWTELQELSPPGLASWLKMCAAKIRLSHYRKQPRGPKKPRPARASGAKVKHVATSKLLKGQKK